MARAPAWDEGAIEEQADAVAQRGWPHDRQEGIRAGADAVVAHRVGEAVVAIGKVNGLRLATSNRPPMPSVELIMKRPAFQRAVRLQLEHEVHERDRFVQVVKHVVQAIAERPGKPSR
jgi:hypothetical protein